MDCNELCKELVKRKDCAHVSLKDSLPYILQLSEKKVQAIEHGVGGFNVNDLMLYIHMCNASINLLGQEFWVIDSVDDLRKCIKSERDFYNISSKKLARTVKIPIAVIEAFESRGGGLRIDSFLDIINTLDIHIQFD